MQLNEKTKKYFTIGSGVVICIGLIIIISMQFGKAPVGKDTLREQSPTTMEIVVEPGNPATSSKELSTEKKEVNIQPNTYTSSGNEETSQPLDRRSAQTDQTEQSIQPKVTKPAEPSKKTKKDATQKPDGTKVDTPPKPENHDTYTPPAGAGEENNSGGLPGFDNVPDGGDNQVIKGKSEGDINKKVGTMD